MLLVDAVFINNSGGKVLLDYLIKSLESSNLSVHYLLDKRCSDSYVQVSNKRKTYIKGSLVTRHNFYKKNIKNFNKIFCFGNVPPTIKTNVPVYTYFHNVSIYEHPMSYRIKEKLTKKLKGFIISFFSKNSNYFIVQSKEVKKILLSNINVSLDKCLVIPFYDMRKEKLNGEKSDSFVYISNGNTHKNHSSLIAAWIELAKRNIFPVLHLTITENYKSLIKQINMAKMEGVKIVNHGYTDAYRLYESNRFLIYPSLCESFGLGLIEAVECGCDVLASDLPYVYEVVDPTETFEPLNFLSIAETVESVLKSEKIKRSSLIAENKVQELIHILN